ncbi:MAG: S-layer protein [Gemmatales bacterium]|nr:MAG: S-layer protein [Gemmatales bacterium]
MRKRFSFLIGLGISFVLPLAGRAADKVPPFGKGSLIALTAIPQKIELNGVDACQQLIVTGLYANNGVRDLTRSATCRSENTAVATVDTQARVTAVADGATTIVVKADGQTIRVPVVVSGTRGEQKINFTNDIIPVLTKLGCNTGACHGKAEGQNGFKLSLLGFEPQVDYHALVRESRGRRVIPTASERSLLLLKPVGAIGHGGGKRLEVGSPEYRILKRWLAAGMPFGNSDDPKVVAISVTPQHRILDVKAQQQLAVTAHYSDGSKVDATQMAEFRTNDSLLLDVDKDGLVTTLGQRGEGSIMVRYQGLVTVFRATIPQETPALAFPKASNLIDEHVFAKLRALGIPPSALCTDGEFIRRASLDITGTLPTAEEAAKFIADKDPKKREKLVDELLQRPAYAAYFALKWGDILRVRGGTRDNKKGNGKKPAVDPIHKRADEFHAWIRKSLQENKPYDQFVREVLTAQGPTSGSGVQPQILWYLELKTPERLVDDTAQAFLGTRIQCAQCHHHPFEKWSQDDYWGLAAFFARIQWQAVGKDKKLRPVRFREGGRMGQVLGYDPKGKLEDRHGKVYDKPRALDGDPIDVPENVDPRQKLADWMASPENPFFAKALVNRYWGHFFGRGLVDPLDDLRITNPPSNPDLLEALAQDFIRSKFDLKHLVRTICTSTTYQLSSLPNDHNRGDMKHHARFLPRRLPAEVLLDAVDQVTGSPTEFTAMGGYKFPKGTRAIELPDAYVSDYFLTVFGKPKRESACECERETDVTLAQRVHLLNGSTVSRKLGSRVARLMADKRPEDEKIKDIYLSFFARYPTADELGAIKQYLAERSKDERTRSAAYSDILWALINTKEFIFNH